MSHASAREKAIGQLKKARRYSHELKDRERKKEMEMGTVAYQEYKRELNKKSLKEEVDTALWDYEKNQYPRMKYGYLKDLIGRRLKEMERSGETENKMKLKRIFEVL